MTTKASGWLLRRRVAGVRPLGRHPAAHRDAAARRGAVVRGGEDPLPRHVARAQAPFRRFLLHPLPSNPQGATFTVLTSRRRSILCRFMPPSPFPWTI